MRYVVDVTQERFCAFLVDARNEKEARDIVARFKDIPFRESELEYKVFNDEHAPSHIYYVDAT